MRMRIVIILITGMTMIAYSQPADSSFYSVGVFADYDGSFLDFVGVKYRFSDSWSSFLKLRYNSSRNTPNGLSPSDHYRHWYYSVTIGVDRVVLNVQNVSLFAHASLGYASEKTTREYVLSMPPNKGTSVDESRSYKLSGGIGAEYHFSTQFSLTVRNSINIEYFRAHSRDSLYGTDTSTDSQYLTLGDVFVTITYYF